MLDKFFWKYEGGVKLTSPLPPEKATLKKHSLIRANIILGVTMKAVAFES